MEEKRVMGKEVVNERTSLYQLKLRNGNHIPFFFCVRYIIYIFNRKVLYYKIRTLNRKLLITNDGVY